MFSDLGLLEIGALAALAIGLFGPDKLPELLRDVTGVLRRMRTMKTEAQRAVRTELGPEFKDFTLEDLNPKTFVRKNLLADDDLGLGDVRDSLSAAGESIPSKKRPSLYVNGVRVTDEEEFRRLRAARRAERTSTDTPAVADGAESVAHEEQTPRHDVEAT